MSTRQTKAACICLMVILPLLTCSSKNDQIEIKQLITNYSTAFDQKDFLTFSDFCTDDFKFYTLDGQEFDKTTVIPFLDRILINWNNVHTIIDNLEIKFDKNLAVARYKTSINFQNNDQQGIMINQITAIFTKTNGVWKLFHFHMSRKYS